MKHLLTIALTSSFLLLSSTRASALYNGSAGTSPAAQGWTRISPLGTETISGGGVVLDTNANFGFLDVYGRNLSSTPIDRTTGFNLRFDLQLINEARNGAASNNTGTDSIDDRAGLSVTVISSDLAGIELGFWTNRIWAQEDGAVKADPTSAPTGTRFTQAEGSPFNTTVLTRYDLSILGNTYFLYAGENYTTPVLQGRLRNYSPEGFPYTLTNSIAIGDNTTSARGSFRLNQVQLSSAITPIPFAFNPLFGLGVFGLSRLRKAITKKK